MHTFLKMGFRNVKAVLFDFDGVVTNTAKLHEKAWAEVLTEWLGPSSNPFSHDDYLQYVDGIPRLQGLSRFLALRDISLPWGNLSDGSSAQTVCGLGNRKNERFGSLLKQEGVQLVQETQAWLQRARKIGPRTFLFSASMNARKLAGQLEVLSLFEGMLDGSDALRLGLLGKAAMMTACAKNLGLAVSECAAVEDARFGVSAAKNAGLGFVVGLAAVGNEKALKTAGADVVLHSMAQWPLPREIYHSGKLPNATEYFKEILSLSGKRKWALFLDYDGTLTPIVERPERALMEDTMRERLRRLSAQTFVAIVSGRGLEDLKAKIGLPEIFYIGNHGFDVEGPHFRAEKGKEFAATLDEAANELERDLAQVPGILVERKRFGLAVHDRTVPSEWKEKVNAVVAQVAKQHPSLKRTFGKCVQELQPNVPWDKGLAVRGLLQALGMTSWHVLPLYVGDDLTDETAFDALGGWGLGVFVKEAERETHADYVLKGVNDVEDFLELLSLRLGDVGT